MFTAPDGVRLHYEVEGNGPPLLLHLGAGCDADLCHTGPGVRLLAKSYGCILFDHSGHGQSEHPAEPSANHIDRYANDVIGLVHSMGYGNRSVLRVVKCRGRSPQGGRSAA